MDINSLIAEIAVAINPWNNNLELNSDSRVPIIFRLNPDEWKAIFGMNTMNV